MSGVYKNYLSKWRTEHFQYDSIFFLKILDYLVVKREYTNLMTTQSVYAKQKPNGLILIIDDQVTNLQMLGTVLRHTNYEIEYASSGEAGLEKINQRVPDLILLDIRMPGLNGWEVMDRLRASKSTREVPVIFLSSTTDEEDVNHCFKIGASDYIAKPLNMMELLCRVNTHFKLKKAKDRILYLESRLRQYTDLESL